MMDLKDFSGKRICVAVSGGVDSVFLLRYLKDRQNAFGYRLSAVHCEHGIRGEESLEDMRFVEALCREWEIGLFLFAEDCPARAAREKVSLETAARNFRRECFESLVESGKTDFIATAHHQGDEAETVLFRMARGTSLTGAGGMREREGWLIRPLLSFSRNRIERGARELGLSHREDRTNADTEITRNKIRHEVLPCLEEAVPGAAENIARFACRAAEDDALLYEYARELLSVAGDGAYLVAFCDKKPLFRRACLLAMKGLGLEKDYTALHLAQTDYLQSLERGAKIVLPKGLEAVKTEDGILFRKIKPTQKTEKTDSKPFDETGFDGGRYEVIIQREPLEPKSGEWRVLRADADKIPAGAIFRFREEGDVFRSFGGCKKTLKKFFNERKIPVEEREYLPLITAAEGGTVYAVCGVEISDTVKVDEGTNNVLYINMRKKKEN